MRVAFRVDASPAIGSGHVMRCLTLADALAGRQAEICFIARHMPQHLGRQIQEQGYSLIALAAQDNSHPDTALQHSDWLGASRQDDARATLTALGDSRWDWLVVDHYGIDAEWETSLRSACQHILVIDDLADRSHDCDALIDQNLHPDAENRYAALVPQNCKLFLGPQFAFLRDEFLQQRQILQPRSGTVRNVLIYFGGMDADNHTMDAISALRDTGEHGLEVNVVIGAQHPDADNIRAVCRTLGYHCHVQTRDMARLMAAADLAVGAGGISAYERLYLRLPSILRHIAENQVEQLQCMTEAGLCELYSDTQDLTKKLSRAFAKGVATPPDCVANGQQELAGFMLARTP